MFFIKERNQDLIKIENIRIPKLFLLIKTEPLGPLTFWLLSFHGSATERLLTGESLGDWRELGGWCQLIKLSSPSAPTSSIRICNSKHPKNVSKVVFVFFFVFVIISPLQMESIPSNPCIFDEPILKLCGWNTQIIIWDIRIQLGNGRKEIGKCLGNFCSLTRNTCDNLTKGRWIEIDLKKFPNR